MSVTDAELTENGARSQDMRRTLVVGLGNPGKKHESNRHNIGFMLVDHLADEYEIGITRRKHKALVGTGHIGKCPVILAKPQTFMNRSGYSVGRLASFYDIPTGDVLVIYDEIDLPFGTIRMREKGGSGGHNGMRSIISHMGPDFPRIRLGVGRPPGRMDPSTYVLHDFRPEQMPVVAEMIDVAIAAIEMTFSDGFDLAMTRFNGLVYSDE